MMAAPTTVDVGATRTAMPGDVHGRITDHATVVDDQVGDLVESWRAPVAAPGRRRVVQAGQRDGMDAGIPWRRRARSVVTVLLPELDAMMSTSSASIG